MKKLRVTIEGKAYNVLVEMLDEAGTASPLPSPSPTPTAPAIAQPAVSAIPAPMISPVAGPRQLQASTGPGDVKSPLAGRVVSVDVQPGQTVAEGTQVLTIEAMKMNTYIYAHKGGHVDAVLVNAGDAVEEGQPLLKIS